MGAITDFMSADHAELDDILSALLKETDIGKAKDLYSLFEADLHAHIVWEEEILFPPFEEKNGMKGVGPTAVMRMEHQQIKQFLQDLKEAIGKGDTPAQPASVLIELLNAHNLKEENILYPWLDQTCSEKEALALLDKIKTHNVSQQCCQTQFGETR